MFPSSRDAFYLLATCCHTFLHSWFLTSICGCHRAQRQKWCSFGTPVLKSSDTEQLDLGCVVSTPCNLMSTSPWTPPPIYCSLTIFCFSSEPAQMTWDTSACSRDKMGCSWENLHKRKLLNKQTVKPSEAIPFQHLPSDSPLWQKKSLRRVLRIHHTVRTEGGFTSHLANQPWCPLLIFLQNPRRGGIKL